MLEGVNSLAKLSQGVWDEIKNLVAKPFLYQGRS
jgi:hypothetical protein